MIKTIVVTYKNEKAMRRDISRRERHGFTVLSATRNGRGWGVAKTVALAFIFPPLAIFGKKGDVFMVTYQHEKTDFRDVVNADKPAKMGFWEQVTAEAKKRAG